MTKRPYRITEMGLRVLRLAKNGSVWDEQNGSGNGGRQRAINPLRAAGYLDWQNKLTIEGDRVLTENGQ